MTATWKIFETFRWPFFQFDVYNYLPKFVYIILKQSALEQYENYLNWLGRTPQKTD